MTRQHYETYLSQGFELRLKPGDEQSNEIAAGKLVSKTARHDIVDGIPRFVPSQNYADNFGLQWNSFKSTQLDSFSGLSKSADRFWANTGWSRTELAGKTVLEIGCGAGRFTEILLLAGAQVVAVDYSNAVDANLRNNSTKGDLFLLQGDLYALPFPDDCFDFVFCFGVLQHTPDPTRAYKANFKKLRPGGKLSMDCYRKRRVPTPWSTPKYLWRPITSRLAPEKLLTIIRWYVPRYLPVDTFLRRLPGIGSLVVAMIPVPCWNYVDAGLTADQRREWAIMDTFDALGAAYDQPHTLKEIQGMIRSSENECEEVFYGSNGIVANITKRPRL